MPIIWIIILALAYTIAGGVFSAKVARAKGYDPFAWFFAGFFFSILALITLAALPANPEAEQ
jgi:hypothetical protein